MTRGRAWVCVKRQEDGNSHHLCHSVSPKDRYCHYSVFQRGNGAEFTQLERRRGRAGIQTVGLGIPLLASQDRVSVFVFEAPHEERKAQRRSPFGK